MTQAGQETNTGTSAATAASGVMAHQYELVQALKAESDRLGAKYHDAYEEIDKAIPIHRFARATKHVDDAGTWTLFEQTETWRLNPLHPNYEKNREAVRRRFLERDRALKSPEMKALGRQCEDAANKWMELEAQMMAAPVRTVGDAHIKITVLKEFMDEDDPQGQEFPLLDLCEQLIKLRTGQ